MPSTTTCFGGRSLRSTDRLTRAQSQTTASVPCRVMMMVTHLPLSRRPLLTTPNHPEYPSAHCTITSAMAEVFSTFFGTNQINLDVHGFDPAGPGGNLNAVRHF